MKGKAAVRLLVGALGIVCVGFFAESAYIFQADKKVDGATSGVQANLLPTVRHMTAIRKAMLDLAVCTPALTQSTSQTAACVDAARERLAAALERYEHLPGFPEKSERLAEVHRALAMLDERLAGLRSAIGSRAQFESAMATALATLDPLDRMVDRLTEANVRNTLRPTSEVRSLLHQSEITELLLAGTALLIAGLATLLGVRAARRRQRFLEGRADELDAFAGTVAHDLLSPLAALGIAMPVIQRRHPDDYETQRLAAHALSGLKRVRALVDGLLDYARAGGVPIGTRADVHGAIGDVVAEMSEQAAAVAVVIKVERADGVVACSPAVLYSILSNLLSNAIKYMDDAKDRTVRVRAEGRGGRVRVEVEDAGPGIPPNLAEAIFAPFVRVPGSGKAGLGLGLATVKRLVAAHGGEVGVRPAKQRGAVFWFELPVVSPEPEPLNCRHRP
jgi:signal transduction histidine kinase